MSTCTGYSIALGLVIVLIVVFSILSWPVWKRYCRARAASLGREADLANQASVDEGGANEFQREMFGEIMSRSYRDLDDPARELGRKMFRLTLTAYGLGALMLACAAIRQSNCG